MSTITIHNERMDHMTPSENTKRLMKAFNVSSMMLGATEADRVNAAIGILAEFTIRHGSKYPEGMSGLLHDIAGSALATALANMKEGGQA